MNKLRFLLLSASLSCSGMAAAEESPPSATVAQALRTAVAQRETDSCSPSTPGEVVVCGRSQQRYRIDRDVLAASRAAQTPPPKAPLDASRDNSCIGPNCGGGTIPLVGMALAALKAAKLAADGDDWRDAFRTHPDQYRRYEDSKAKRSKKPAIGIGASATNK